MMLKRYARKEMADIWTLEHRFQKMLEVEKAVAWAQGNLNLIPMASAQAIQSKANFCLENIQENEKTTRHDVTAFVQELARQVGEPDGSYVHWGLSSSDVLDTALALQIKSAAIVLEKSFVTLEKAITQQALEYAGVLCLARTHGMAAEPITFGLKLVGFLWELRRHKDRVQRALCEAQRVKISGATGTYSTLPIEVEKKVCEKLNLQSEPVATQVVPRDRYAEIIVSLAMTAAGLERLAVEIRHLQREEVGEVFENFTSGQTGSSAMPHKKNPIYSENITGLSRLLRSYVQPALENIVLWHERDISHSSVERVIFPSAFTLCDFALMRMAELIRSLQVNKDRMLQNIKSAGGVIFSSVLLSELVRSGMSRSKAYSLIQSISLSTQDKTHFQNQVLVDKTVLKYLNKDKINNIFSLSERQQQLSQRVKFLLKAK